MQKLLAIAHGCRTNNEWSDPTCEKRLKAVGEEKSTGDAPREQAPGEHFWILEAMRGGTVELTQTSIHEYRKDIRDILVQWDSDTYPLSEDPRSTP